jgi:regulator of protease activity HflC (stomatin/prohibitin superfamily)
MIFGILTSSIKQIDAGSVGIESLFGKVSDRTLSSGLNLVNPLVEVTTIDTKTQNYTMSAVHDEGDKDGDDAIRILTADGLQVEIDLTILYRVIPSEAPKIYREIGRTYVEKIVRPITRTRIRDNAVNYDAVALYSTKRDEFQARIFKQIEQEFKMRGIFLENVLIRNISLPESVKKPSSRKSTPNKNRKKCSLS